MADFRRLEPIQTAKLPTEVRHIQRQRIANMIDKIRNAYHLAIPYASDQSVAAFAATVPLPRPSAIEPYELVERKQGDQVPQTGPIYAPGIKSGERNASIEPKQRPESSTTMYLRLLQENFLRKYDSCVQQIEDLREEAAPYLPFHNAQKKPEARRRRLRQAVDIATLKRLNESEASNITAPARTGDVNRMEVYRAGDPQDMDRTGISPGLPQPPHTTTPIIVEPSSSSEEEEGEYKLHLWGDGDLVSMIERKLIWFFRENGPDATFIKASHLVRMRKYIHALLCSDEHLASRLRRIHSLQSSSEARLARQYADGDVSTYMKSRGDSSPLVESISADDVWPEGWDLGMSKPPRKLLHGKRAIKPGQFPPGWDDGTGGSPGTPRRVSW